MRVRVGRRRLLPVPEESLLTDDVRALIGQSKVIGKVTVTRQAYKRALDTYTGRHNDPPPDGAEVPGYVLDGLSTEEDVPRWPNFLPQQVNISNEWEFERPLRMGEEFVVSTRLASISERFGGRFGYSLDVRTETVYSEAATGVEVARKVSTMSQYNVAEAPIRGER